MGDVVGPDDRNAGTAKDCRARYHFSQVFEIARYFGLDPYQQFWFSTTDPTIAATQHHVEGMVSNMDDYLRLRPQLFPDHGASISGMAEWASRQRRGEAVVWATIEGFFWFPRTLMGFEKMMYAYEDEPELLHLINQDLLDFNFRLLDEMLPVCVPTFMTIAEDMSYNFGPMISKRTFDEFVAPYYRKLVPRLQEHNIPLIMDTDGDVTMLVPWLQEIGVRGVLPLERQAGVDGLKLRQQFPGFFLRRPFRQDDHEPRRAGHARRVRAARSPDEIRWFHPQCRSPDASGRFVGAIPVLSGTFG